MFINIELSKSSDPRGLILNISDEINFNWNDKVVALSNLTIYLT